jgi:diadenosine tetraphosphate (Ap4A) HIT family hydrolase
MGYDFRLDDNMRIGIGENMNFDKPSECRFCGYFGRQAVELVDTPWLKDDEYCAIVSKGALVPGWSLICPVGHDVGLTSHYCSAKFWDFASKAESVIRARYGDVRVFEHGAGYAGSPTGCGTDHAHLHLVPLQFSLATEALRSDSALKWSSCKVEDIKERVAGREYLFVSDRFDGSRTSGLLCLLGLPISQFFRRVVASRLGMKEFYDYRRHPMLEIAERTALDLRADAVAGEHVESQ